MLNESHEKGIITLMASEYRAVDMAEHDYITAVSDPYANKAWQSVLRQRRARVEGMEMVLGAIVGTPAYERIRSAAKEEANR